jgi:hypothetical protein
MESTNLTLIMISVALIPFLLPLVIILYSLVYRYKAGEMATFADFKDNIQFLKNKNITMTDYYNELLCKKAKLASSKSKISKYLAVVLFTNFYIIITNLARYDLAKCINNNAQIKFPIVEVTSLILLSTWISAMLFLNLVDHRINLYLEKLSQFKKHENDLDNNDINAPGLNT